MRFTFLLLLCLQYSFLSAQDVTATLQPASYDRYEDVSVNLDIPYKNGILKAYLKSKTFSRTIKLRKITSNGVEENEIDIDFGTEKLLSLIGFLSINNQPVIFYCLNRPQESKTYFPVTIKAAVLDWETLKVIKKTELKTFEPQPNPNWNFEFSNSFAFEQRGHVIKAKLSAEGDKYVLFFDDIGEKRPVRKYYVWVFDKDLNRLYDEQEVIEEPNVKLVDFGVSNTNFFLIYQVGESCITQQDPDYSKEVYYCDKFSTLVRKTDLSNTTSVDMKFENVPGFIKMSRLLFNTKNNVVNIGGLYSKNWDSYVSGSFWGTVDDKNKKIVVSAKNDFPSEDYLSKQFNAYEGRKEDEEDEEKKEAKCSRCRYKLTSFFAKTNENNRSDMVFEAGYRSFNRYGLVIIVTITPTGDIKNNFIQKPQKLPTMKGTSYTAGGSFFTTGAYACYYKNQLLLFYNDNLLNQAQTTPPKVLYFDKKTNWGLFMSSIDEAGTLTGKKLLLDNTEDKYFAEITQTWSDNNNLYFPASSVKSDYSEFRLGTIKIK